MIRKYTSVLAIAAASLAIPALAQDVPEEIGSAVDAASAAGVVEALAGMGEVTVFVPTNDAIAAAPGEVPSGEALATLIQGYAVEGTVMAADAVEMTADGEATVDSLAGTSLTISSEDGSVMVGSGETMATVVTPDLQLGNVTIHVIDTAFLPQ